MCQGASFRFIMDGWICISLKKLCKPFVDIFEINKYSVIWNRSMACKALQFPGFFHFVHSVTETSEESIRNDPKPFRSMYLLESNIMHSWISQDGISDFRLVARDGGFVDAHCHRGLSADKQKDFQVLCRDLIPLIPVGRIHISIWIFASILAHWMVRHILRRAVTCQEWIVFLTTRPLQSIWEID
jgi:hypothetical protein